MKIRNCLFERFARVACQHFLKPSERFPGVFKNLFAFNGVAGVNIADVVVTPPAVAVLVFDVIFPVVTRQKVQRFTFGVAAVFLNFPAQKARYPDNVFHQRVRVFENISVNFLYHIVFFLPLVVLKTKLIGGVNVSVV